MSLSDRSSSADSEAIEWAQIWDFRACALVICSREWYWSTIGVVRSIVVVQSSTGLVFRGAE